MELIKLYERACWEAAKNQDNVANIHQVRTVWARHLHLDLVNNRNEKELTVRIPGINNTSTCPGIQNKLTFQTVSKYYRYLFNHSGLKLDLSTTYRGIDAQIFVLQLTWVCVNGSPGIFWLIGERIQKIMSCPSPFTTVWRKGNCKFDKPMLAVF